MEWFSQENENKFQVIKELRIWDTMDEKTITSKHPPMGKINYSGIEIVSFVKTDKKTGDEVETIIK